MEKEDGLFRVSEVARLLGVPARNLSQWCDRGLVRPESPAEGSGTRNLFTLEDLCRTALFIKLSRTFTLAGASSVAFASKGHPVHQAFFTALGKLARHKTDKKSSKTLLSQNPPPEALYVAFTEAGKEMEATRPCGSARELAETLAGLSSHPFFLVVNLTQIAVDVLEKIEADRG